MATRVINNKTDFVRTFINKSSRVVGDCGEHVLFSLSVFTNVAAHGSNFHLL